MSTLLLIRFRSDDQGTFGALIIPGFGSLVTVERQWLDRDEDGKHWPYGIDKRSCVPEGHYRLSREHSNKFGRSMWYLIGQGVNYRPVPGEPTEWRSGCMFHGANRAIELEGCVAPGKIYDAENSQVLKSQTALGELTLALGQISSPQLMITNAFYR